MKSKPIPHQGCSALVTAIMPLKYFKPCFLQSALQSMRDQSDPDWRLLIVVEAGDYSTLNNQLCQDLKDDRIEMMTTERPGFVGSINTGMYHAGTEYTALLFADDRWTEKAIKVLNDHIRSYPQVDFFHSSRAVIDERDQIISPVFESKERFKIESFKWGSPVKHLLCWRRTKALAIGGIDETLTDHGPDDYDFPWSMAEHGASFKAIKECLYLYRNHCDYYRLTTHVPRSRMKREVNKILRKHGVSWWERKKIIWKKSLNGNLGGQSLYNNHLQEWIANKLGIDATENWRQNSYQRSEKNPENIS